MFAHSLQRHKVLAAGLAAKGSGARVFPANRKSSKYFTFGTISLFFAVLQIRDVYSGSRIWIFP
jgi:hypothetical protein